MTTRTWNGANDSYTNAGDWSPAGVPASGDTAVINSGNVTATGTISGIYFALNQSAGASSSSTLTLTNATLDAASQLSVNNGQSLTTAAPAVISVNGTSTIAGTASFYGTTTNFAISSGATLVNSGTLNFYSSSPRSSGGGALQNSGTIAVVNPNSGLQVAVLADPITGTGTIALGEHARFELDGPVSAGQTIIMNDGSNGHELLQFNALGTVQATIKGFSATDQIIINTSGTYGGASYSNGVLTLNGVGTLNLPGPYSTGSFSVQTQSVGNGTNDLFITTSVNNNVSGGLPPGYQNGGSGLGVYRFFDTVLGTHLFTQSQSEALNILATRPDLTEETNNFGAVAQGSPAAEPVYRFFETTNGTHFYTASQAEFNALTTQGSSDYRPDLTYEPTSTIYEDSTQRTGDLPVFRLFDTVHGTQFLTGSQTEYAGLTTQGSGTFRGDLTPEGVAFYAPAGTFHT